MSAPETQRAPSLTLTNFPDQVLDAAIQVYLPDTLTVAAFIQLLPYSSSSKPAFTFPALRNWLFKLLKNLKLQEDENHPYHKHPYRLRGIDVQAVDWFSPTKLGFMKIQAKIETDPYLHEGAQDAEADWLPGAVFLRGGSVAMLVRPHGHMKYAEQN